VRIKVQIFIFLFWNLLFLDLSGTGARLLKEITLNDPIRYSIGDPIEEWLNNLLLLDATQAVKLRQGK
jgi:tRNA(Met) C34 N-acetyltransferase TmcA